MGCIWWRATPLLAQLLVDRCKLENDQETLFTTTEFKDSLLAHINEITQVAQKS